MLQPPGAFEALRVTNVSKLFESDVSTERLAAAPARFAVGDEVRTRATEVNHHTRLPRYAWGKRGRIESMHGARVFPDMNAHGLGEQPNWLYTVAFMGRELWGEDTVFDLTVSIEAWEPYLEPLA